MENPSEGENKHYQESWHTPPHPDSDSHNSPILQPPSPMENHPFAPPNVPAPQPPAPAAVPQNPTAPHPTNPLTIILQWLTYAFWGWTVLVLSVLTSIVFSRLINGDDTSSFNYYIISAALVLLPISFVCDFFYSKEEPKKKTGAAMVVMIIHAVLFALFGIGALIFAVFSFVTLFTNTGSNGPIIAALLSALIITVFYGATFIRTLNPAIVSWIPKVYRIIMLVIIGIFIILGFTKPTFHSTPKTVGSNPPSSTSTPLTSSTPSNNFGSDGKLEPSVVGGTQCDLNTLPDGSTYAQVAILGGATCTVAESVIQGSSGNNGNNYSSNGYSCTATKQGSGTQWSSYWNNDFYSYNCSMGSAQVAFNWQSLAQSNASSSSSTSTVQ